MIKALIICISYHSNSEINQFVDSVLKQSVSEVIHLLIVDNNEKKTINKQLLNTIQENNSSITFIKTNKNLGYFGGAAWGFKQYLNSHKEIPDWIILSNTDIVFRDLDFFKTLFGLSVDQKCGIIAPSIKSKLSNFDQNPYILKRPSRIRIQLYKWIFYCYGTYLLYQIMALIKKILKRISKYTFLRKKIKQKEIFPQFIYAPHGSMIIFHRNYFIIGGTFDYGAFLFGEEIFVAETTKKIGLRILYIPNLVVIHNEHATTGMIKSRRLFKYLRESTIYNAKTFFCQLYN